MIESRLVYQVIEENHGVIGIADKAITAAEMLITSDWVTLDDNVWCGRKKEYISISEAMEHLGYPINDESFRIFVANMLEDSIKGYEWGFHFRTISFYEEV